VKNPSFLIFFFIISIIYGLLNYYIINRGWQCLPKSILIRTAYLTLTIFLASSYILGRVLERTSIPISSEWLLLLGSFWIAYFVYSLMLVLGIDFIRLLNRIFHFFPDFLQNPSTKIKYIFGTCAFTIISFIVFIGYANQCSPRIKKMEIKIAKKTGRKELRIAFASDIHLGIIYKGNRIKKLVELIDSIHPDVVIFGGDVIDEDIAPVIRYNLGELLVQITKKYPTYTIFGNHEYIGGHVKSQNYLEEHGFQLLQDRVTQIDSNIYLIGRDDYTGFRFSNIKRKELPELVQSIEASKVKILLDHQPFQLQKVVDAGIDLQLSGHTHHGQMWPFNFITQSIYELSWGYLKKGNTHFYVSCGFGTWGPPIRLGSKPEIIDLLLKFE